MIALDSACIYSHDRHLLKAAPEFGITGCDVIAGEG